MSSMRVLAFSSSRVYDSPYLGMAAPVITDFLGDRSINIAFIPFADAANDYGGYLVKTKNALAALPYTISAVTPHNPKSVIAKADAIMVGGGNTFKLLHHLYHYELMELIGERVRAGVPYIGWSAGSNIAGLSIGTTNDMPIIQPKSFKALNFFPFQINPHYINLKPEGHNGESRDERLGEYLKVNPSATIVGLPEGTALLREGKTLKLVGQGSAVVFKAVSNEPEPDRTVIYAAEDISWLL